jgi:integrase/recombinase XerD
MYTLTEHQLVSLIKKAFSELNSENAVTFHGYVKEKYWPYFLSKKRTDNSVRIETLRINILLELVSADVLLSKMTENDVRIVLNKISKRKKGSETISNATVNRYHSRFLAIFNHAVREGILQKNPLRNVKKAKEYPRNRILTEEELARLLASCKVSKNKELSAIVAIAIYTGMRLGEVQGLLLSNIDMELELIILNEWQTKGNSSRAIPIHPFIKKTIEKLVFDAMYNGRENLFISRSLRTAKEKAIKRTGLKNFICRDLRRIFATTLNNTNANIHTISRLLGHSSITMTEKYLGISVKELKSAVEAIPSIKE